MIVIKNAMPVRAHAPPCILACEALFLPVAVAVVVLVLVAVIVLIVVVGEAANLVYAGSQEDRALANTSCAT